MGLLLPFLLQRPGYVAAQYAGWVEQLAQNDRQMRPRELWYRDARLLWSLGAAPMSSRAYQVVQAAGAAVAAGPACGRGARAWRGRGCWRCCWGSAAAG